MPQGAVLAFLCAWAEYQTCECFATMDFIARATKQSIQGARKAVSALERMGYIEVMRQRGNGKMNRYRMLVADFKRIPPEIETSDRLQPPQIETSDRLQPPQIETSDRLNRNEVEIKIASKEEGSKESLFNNNINIQDVRRLATTAGWRPETDRNNQARCNADRRAIIQLAYEEGLPMREAVRFVDKFAAFGWNRIGGGNTLMGLLIDFIEQYKRDDYDGWMAERERRSEERMRTVERRYIPLLAQNGTLGRKGA